ncbi:MAG TPA: FixH family protein [Bryobacteraceae bacterium]|nr:FixH family protein [Bryobacteraceae bacterium]
MKLAAFLLLGLGLLFAQERNGNFGIRFEPTAVLQTGAPIPFQITVHDTNHNPLPNAKVTLQIETPNHTHVKVFAAPPVDQRAQPGVYVAKPVFDIPGEWNVYVEVHRRNGRWEEMSARTIQFTVPETAQ